MLVYFLFRIQSAILTFCGEFHEFQELNMSQSLVFCKWVRCRMSKSLRELCQEIKPNSGNKKCPPWNLLKHKNSHLKHWREAYKYKRKRGWVTLLKNWNGQIAMTHPASFCTGMTILNIFVEELVTPLLKNLWSPNMISYRKFPRVFGPFCLLDVVAFS